MSNTEQQQNSRPIETHFAVTLAFENLAVTVIAVFEAGGEACSIPAEVRDIMDENATPALCRRLGVSTDFLTWLTKK